VPEPSQFWSSTDFPYTCLRDRRRTAALAAVVAATVRPGDVVLDAGAGTGVLALYAARAGARRVHAVETDPVLCRYLRQTVQRNGYADVIEVVEADVHSFAVPTVDVALAELIETALVDEALVSAYNALLGTGTVGRTTRCLPADYTTFGQPVLTDDRYDGFEVVALRHDWAHYERDPQTWGTWTYTPAGPAVEIWHGEFGGEPLEPAVSARVPVPPQAAANGLRLTGELGMPDGSRWTDFPSLNGPKIVPLPPRPPGSAAVQVSYTMSAGFPGFEARWV
jgi:protein arginine N-methyltransferase 7